MLSDDDEILPVRSTAELTRTQLVSMVASLRGELRDVVTSLTGRDHEDSADAYSLLEDTQYDVAPADLVDGRFDCSWRERPAPEVEHGLAIIAQAGTRPPARVVDAAAVKRARELCGCSQCQGGYEIGGRTIAMQRGEQRPYSCVAAVVLGRLGDWGE